MIFESNAASPLSPPGFSSRLGKRCLFVSVSGLSVQPNPELSSPRATFIIIFIFSNDFSKNWTSLRIVSLEYGNGFFFSMIRSVAQNWVICLFSFCAVLWNIMIWIFFGYSWILSIQMFFILSCSVCNARQNFWSLIVERLKMNSKYYIPYEREIGEDEICR